MLTHPDFVTSRATQHLDDLRRRADHARLLREARNARTRARRPRTLLVVVTGRTKDSVPMRPAAALSAGAPAG
jgi:hypothetical protein